MPPITRRHFVLTSFGMVPALWVAKGAQAANAHLDPAEPAAKAAGYVAIAAQANAKRFPQYKAGQACASCSLFQGGKTDAWGGCLIFGTKQVARGGWCASYANM